ncbi:hypothetical protein P9112_001008 [Eukaryota sp. TZLM1-RC]
MASIEKSRLTGRPIIRNVNGDCFVVTPTAQTHMNSIVPPPKSETQRQFTPPSATSAGGKVQEKPLIPYNPNCLRSMAKIHDPPKRSCHDTNLPRGAPCPLTCTDKKRFITSKMMSESQKQQPTGFGNTGILSQHTKFIRNLQNS